jgi:hypothetical protein
LPRDFVTRFGRINGVPRVEDVWIFSCVASPNHFTHSFIPKVEELFQIGNKTLTLEAFGLSLHFVCQRLCQDIEQQLFWQLDISNEQMLSLVPFDLHSFSPITEENKISFEVKVQPTHYTLERKTTMILYCF